MQESICVCSGIKQKAAVALGESVFSLVPTAISHMFHHDDTENKCTESRYFMALPVVLINCVLMLAAASYSGESLFADIGPEYDQSSNPEYTNSSAQFPQQSGSGDRELARQMLGITNGYRKQIGMEPLSQNSALLSTATEQAAYMCRSKELRHGSPEGALKEKLAGRGFRGVNIGQNIAKQENSDYRALAQAWVRSFEHRKNILGDFTYSEVATCRDDEGNRYWVQVFGKNASNREISDVAEIQKLRKFLEGGHLGAESSRYVVMLKPDNRENDAPRVARRGMGLFDGLKPLRSRHQDALHQLLEQIFKNVEVPSTAGSISGSPGISSTCHVNECEPTTTTRKRRRNRSDGSEPFVVSTVFINNPGPSTGSMPSDPSGAATSRPSSITPAPFSPGNESGTSSSKIPSVPITIYTTTTNYVFRTITESSGVVSPPSSPGASRASVASSLGQDSSSNDGLSLGSTTKPVSVSGIASTSSKANPNRRLERKIDKIANMVKSILEKGEAHTRQPAYSSQTLPPLAFATSRSSAVPTSMRKKVASFRSSSTDSPTEKSSDGISSLMSELRSIVARNEQDKGSSTASCKCGDSDRYSCCIQGPSTSTSIQYENRTPSTESAASTPAGPSKQAPMTAKHGTPGSDSIEPLISLILDNFGLRSRPASSSMSGKSGPHSSSTPAALSPSVSTASSRCRPGDPSCQSTKSSSRVLGDESIPKSAIVSAIKDLLRKNEFNVRILDKDNEKDAAGQIEIPKALFIMG